MKTLYASVCKNTVLSNLKHGKSDPVIRISRGRHGKPKRCHVFTFPLGYEVRIVYDPTNPMPWGARAWVEALPPEIGL